MIAADNADQTDIQLVARSHRLVVKETLGAFEPSRPQRTGGERDQFRDISRSQFGA
jgi:hypothetical protein